MFFFLQLIFGVYVILNNLTPWAEINEPCAEKNLSNLSSLILLLERGNRGFSALFPLEILANLPPRKSKMLLLALECAAFDGLIQITYKGQLELLRRQPSLEIS